MAILPDFLETLVTTNLALLQQWFSEQMYQRMLQRNQSHVLVKLNKRLDFTAMEAACAYYHLEGPGAKPTYTTVQLLRVLVIKYLYGLSYRTAEREIETNLLLRWFVGLGLFAPVPDHVTLQRFETRLREHHQRLLFDDILRQIDQDFPEEKRAAQIGDTFAVRAAAAEEHLIELLRHTCECSLRCLEKYGPEQYDKVVGGWVWSGVFGPPDEIREYYLDEEERRLRLETTVRAILDFIERLTFSEAIQHPAVQGRVEDLEKILADEVRLIRAAAGQVERVERLPLKERGSYRLGSATDPDATYRIHGKKVCFGYNVSLAATPEGIIREIHAATGAEPDQNSPALLVSAQIEHQHICPSKIIFDQAAGAGKTRAEIDRISDGKTQLVAKVLSSVAEGRFGPADFRLSADELSLTCPNEVTTTNRYRSEQKEAFRFSFSAAKCKGCELAERCRNPKAKPTSERRVSISDHQEWIEKARAYNQTAEYKADMKLRPRIERIIAMLTRYDNARQAYARGLPYVDFQQKLVATARNLRTWMKLIAKREKCLEALPG
jgi:hypothetical protein